jgi:hypothetical protein
LSNTGPDAIETQVTVEVNARRVRSRSGLGSVEFPSALRCWLDRRSLTALDRRSLTALDRRSLTALDRRSLTAKWPARRRAGAVH